MTNVRDHINAPASAKGVLADHRLCRSDFIAAFLCAYAVDALGLDQTRLDLMSYWTALFIAFLLGTRGPCLAMHDSELTQLILLIFR